MIGQTIAHYRIDRCLGQGGMGAVYAAHDTRLERPVAIKRIRADLAEPTMRERFWREARAAAALNHPGVCQVHEVREEGNELYIVMELLEGETLHDRLTRGALELGEALRVGLGVLDALAALHARRFVHRDLKPSNVFLLRDGRVKLLDFGLAYLVSTETSAALRTGLTTTGLVVGSPRYMAPEQIRGERVDQRADLFSFAALMYEAVTGHPLFQGNTPIQVMHAVLNEHPAALGGSTELEALGRVLERSLAKRPEERHPDAEAFAAELRQLAAGGGTSTSSAVPIERVVRLAVLPFRMLRPDPELDFLGPSLADAITMSLAGIRSLVVRSTVASARFAGPTLHLEEMAKALEVDVVLVGTIVASGERCRVAAQLVSAPRGDVVWSQTVEVEGRDVFLIQDTLAKRIVDSLQLPLSSRERRALSRDVPASATAYELFLRANRVNMVGGQFTIARDLYLRALEEDPSFAPAWARLGRCYRILGKYFVTGREENYRRSAEALDRALELHTDLPSAHYYKAQLELDHGKAELALDRLLAVVERNPNDPNGYAGLVSAFRYVGLIEESLVANDRARALDPEIPTSLHYTLESLGEIERALKEPETLGAVRGRLLALTGRVEEGIQHLREAAAREEGNVAGALAALGCAALEGDRAAALRALEVCEGFPDPEGLYFHGTACANVGERDWAVRLIEESIQTGYANVVQFARDPWLDPIRDDERLQRAFQHAEAHHRAAAAVYRGRIT